MKHLIKTSQSHCAFKEYMYTVNNDLPGQDWTGTEGNTGLFL